MAGDGPAGTRAMSVKTANFEEVRDDREIGGVRCEEWHAVDACRRRDHKIHCALAWAPAALGDRGRKAAPFAGDRRIDRQRIEGRLDDPEALRAACSLVCLARGEDAEMQLRERRDADRALELAWICGTDQHGRVEEDATHANGSVSSPCSRVRSSSRVRGGGVSKTRRRSGPLTHRRFAAGPSRATGLPATVIVNSSPASARRRTSPTLLRSSFWGIVVMPPKVAELLPARRVAVQRPR